MTIFPQGIGIYHLRKTTIDAPTRIRILESGRLMRAPHGRIYFLLPGTLTDIRRHTRSSYSEQVDYVVNMHMHTRILPHHHYITPRLCRQI